MNIAFTGDLVLQEINKSPSEIFQSFIEVLREKDAELCVNLESPFITNGMKPIKDKITLFATGDKIAHLKYLSPFLINLANNHINDFGNLSCELTINELKQAQFTFFGVGLEENKENVVIDSDKEIIYLAYATRSTDFTGSRLFAEKDFFGPYAPDFEQISSLKKQYPSYRVIINIHWGIEDITYPEPDKRNLAYDLIDHGADLIIGHHPHIVQPVEKYKDKYIVYSVGNFYFPDLYHPNKDQILKKALPHQKKGIVPIFKIGDQVELVSVLEVQIDNNNCLKVKKGKFKLLGAQNRIYKIFHPLYLFILFNTRRVHRVLKNPGLIIKKLT